MKKKKQKKTANTINLVGKITWTRKWQPASVFLPGKFHGQRRPVGYSLWGRKESDTTVQLSMHTHVDCTNHT